MKFQLFLQQFMLTIGFIHYSMALYKFGTVYNNIAIFIYIQVEQKNFNIVIYSCVDSAMEIHDYP